VDNSGKTITVMQSDLGWIFGGYNSVSWRIHNLDAAIWPRSGHGAHRYHTDPDAFLFTDQGLPGAVNESRFVKLHVDPEAAPMAVYQSAESGPLWGEYGHDLNVNADMNTGYTTAHSYASSHWQCDETSCPEGGLAGSHDAWTITELETFAVSGCATQTPTGAPTSAPTPPPTDAMNTAPRTRDIVGQMLLAVACCTCSAVLAFGSIT
jgi:hypothetical protein